MDIKTAKNAGIKCVSVTWGFATKEVLLENEAEIMVDKPCEIIDLIERGTL